MAFDRRKMRFEVYKTPEQKAEEANRPPRRLKPGQLGMVLAMCLAVTASTPTMPEMRQSRNNKRGW